MPKDALGRMQSPFELYAHQEAVLTISKDLKSFGWFLETGTGKTIVAIENIKYLKETGKINFAMIAAPKIVCEAVWEVELWKYFKCMPYRLFKWVGSMSGTDSHTMNWYVKNIKDIREMSDRLPILLVNIEAFSHTKIFKMIDEVLRETNNIVIIDESTTIKNPKTKRTKGLLTLAGYCNYKRILSGFPILKSPEDLYTQVKFLGNGLIPFQSFYAFRNQFCNLKHMGKYDVTIGHKNLGMLGDMIKPFSIRITKKECLDLPDKVRTKRYIEMTPEQDTMYKQMKEQSYVLLENTQKQVFATTFLAQLSKLQQIANGVLIQQRETNLPCYKYDYLLDILENEIPDQCVIWFSYITPLARAMMAISKKFGPGASKAIHGDIPQHERVLALKAFQDRRCRYLLANPATAMFGLNLTCCSYSIYFCNSTSLEHRIQSEDRLHRIGQVNKATYIDLVTKGTVEDKILEKLQKNHKVGAEVLNDEWKEWFR